MGAGRVVGDVLVDHRVGEPGQRQAVGVDGRLDLGPAVDADRPLEQLWRRSPAGALIPAPPL